MAESRQVELGPDGSCRASLGAYYVSKSLVNVTIRGVHDRGQVHKNRYDPLDLELKVEGPNAVPDRRHGYCLNFLGSPTSHDLIAVDRKDGLLHRVSSLADDQSVEVAKRIVDVIFFGATHFGLPTPGSLRGDMANAGYPEFKLIDVDFDPADPIDAAMINDRLNDFGFCLILEGQPPIDDREHAKYCEDPNGYIARRSFRGKKRPSDDVIAGLRRKVGFFYRPRRPYNYFLLQKHHRQDPDSWRLRSTKVIELENLSPLLSIGVGRSFFTRRRTELVFDDGVLKDIKLDKNSELTGFVEIPLYIVNTVVSIPGQILQLRINNTDANRDLARAELNLLNKRLELQRTQDEIIDHKLEEIKSEPN